MDRRFKNKESIYQKEKLDAEAIIKEIESKLVKEIDEQCQLFEEFGVLKEQYVKLEEENEALHGRTWELDAKNRELEELQNELVFIRAQVSPVVDILDYRCHVVSFVI